MANSGWRETTIGVLCDEGVLYTQTGPFGSQLHSYDYVPRGIPVVPTEGIGRRRLITKGIPEIAEETAARLSRHRLKAGDILFARRGVQATGLSALVTPRQEGWICGTGAILLRVKQKSVDPDFLSFVLSADSTVLWLKQHAVGAVMPNLNESVIRRVPLVVPPLAEQKAIAAVLGALDEKIELNQRMNETLDSMSRVLFKSWFVDFDPVRARQDGRQPAGLDAATAELFPDTFQDSLAGHIPTGWAAGKLSEFMEVGIGGAWGEELPSSKQSVAVRCLRGIDCHDLAERGCPDAPIRYLSEQQAQDRRLAEGCMLVEGSGSFCGRSMVWLADFERLTGSAVSYSNFCKRLDPRCSVSQALVCWMQFRAAYDAGVLANFRTGTAFPNFDIHGALNGLDVICPPKEICDLYLKTYRNWLRIDLVLECRTLATLRDTLLPKLLSGELKVA